MAKRASSKSKGKAKSKTPSPAAQLRSLKRRVVRGAFKLVLAVLGLLIALVLLFAVINPPTTPYMFSEGRRLGGVDQQWVALEDVAPVMARSVVAAEDANFCEHWGFDLAAIKRAIAEGSNRGASTLSQQTVKNVYLWHGRTWLRKALEAGITPLVETVWTKRRIIEVYLNVAEFDEGIFGVDLVREQLRVAAGMPMSFGQDDLSINGHAIEVRINAEKLPNFTPCPGKISQFHAPGGLGVRMDSALYDGYSIPPYYDSLIGKLIVHGRDRPEALARLNRALGELIVDGIDTTIPLFHELLQEDDIHTGDYNIHWLEKWLEENLAEA